MALRNHEDHVFINCPFDSAYLDMYRACIFAITDAGFIPRCSKEVNNSAQFRLNSIVNIISECRYGIHDLSRVELDKEHDLPRFNMPFELGIFYGAIHFGKTSHKSKCCLILERDPFRYQKYISDISGFDVTSHNNNPEELISGIRSWLHTSSQRNNIPTDVQIIERFKLFQDDIKQLCSNHNIEYDLMSFRDFYKNIADWLRRNEVVCTPLFG